MTTKVKQYWTNFLIQEHWFVGQGNCIQMALSINPNGLRTILQQIDEEVNTELVKLPQNQQRNSDALNSRNNSHHVNPVMKDSIKTHRRASNIPHKQM
jgi:hypothetical protein